MAKKMLIDATHAEETRVVVVDGNKVEEFDFESENKRQLAGNIYLAKVTRVEPSLQAAFVDYGGNRHGFLAFSEIHPDYYQIPVADREALLEEERAYAEAMKARDEEDEKPKKRSRGRGRSKAEKVVSEDAVTASEEISGMETIDLEGSDEDASLQDNAETVEQDTAQDDAVAVADVAEDTVVTSEENAAEDAVEEAAAPVEAGENVEAKDSDDAPEVEDEGDEEAKRSDASSKDTSIESVADEDDTDDIRPPRKPRPRRYKIQEVIKVRQILLIQVVKEERGNKGAALTTYLSLAGRYCVLMPNTARGGGISRKITNVADRKKLKDIATEIDVPQGAGLIVRTAGAKRTKSEIKRDYEYLQRMWEQIRELTLKSIAPAKIYEEGDLIKRSIRDLYNREIDEVQVEGERGYRIAKDFMKMIMPSHAKNVRHYQETMPLFARHQVESYLSGMFNPTVQLKSGGYIVIGVTEALVAIDVNSGRATKEGSIEETALKTNLEAAEEVARQLRLRDLAGLIVIDFIDMDERKNNASVEKRMKDRLKTDRARIQVGRISGFGLMEMSRQRLRPGMIEATTQPCQACHGTGLIRSDDNLALAILRQIEEEGVRNRTREVLIKCPVAIANFLMNQKREHVAQIEARYGLSVRIEGDPTLVSPEFTMEKFKTATRHIPERVEAVISADSSIMDEVIADEEESKDEVNDARPEDADGEVKPKKRRRRRRRRSKSQRDGDAQATDANADTGENTAETAEAAPEGTDGDAGKDTVTAADETTQAAPAESTVQEDEAAPKAKPKRTRRPRKSSKSDAAEQEVVAAPVEVASESDASEAVTKDAVSEPEEKPKKKATRKPRKKAEPKAKVVADAEPAETPVSEAQIQVEAVVEAPTPEIVTPEAVAPVAEPVVEVAENPEPAAPKRKGWWSLTR